MIAGYKKLKKQVILTSTLKDEEYDKDKYEKIDDIKAINYSEFKIAKFYQIHIVQILLKYLIHLE